MQQTRACVFRNFRALAAGRLFSDPPPPGRAGTGGEGARGVPPPRALPRAAGHPAEAGRGARGHPGRYTCLEVELSQNVSKPGKHQQRTTSHHILTHQNTAEIAKTPQTLPQHSQHAGTMRHRFVLLLSVVLQRPMACLTFEFAE